jgi:isovaleryl-CoA dehydrogenase
VSSTLTASVSSNYRSALERIIADVVAPSATQVDQQGAFPTQNIQALGEAGLLGLLSATEVGGGGLGLRDAAEVIERLSAACGSTAMVVLMHYAAVSSRWPPFCCRCRARGPF